MKVEEIDNHVERLVAVGMIVSTDFIQGIQPIYSPDFIETPFARTVASWCLDYWKHYHKAPGVHIQDIYRSHARNGLNPDQAELISGFLESISHEYERSERLNVEYYLTQAEARFKAVSLRHLSEDVQAMVSEGNHEGAERLMAGYKRVERPQTHGVNPLTDRDAIYEAFNSVDKDILYTRPGALGDFLGPAERGSFTAIMGSEKMGKTWWLMQDSLWALGGKCNVAFFECGDMTQSALIRRIHCNLARCGTSYEPSIPVPVMDCRLNQENACTRQERKCDLGVFTPEGREQRDTDGYVPCTACRKERDSEWEGAAWRRTEVRNRMEWEKAIENGRKIAARSGRRFMLSVHPAKTINVQGIKSQLDMWERMDSFVPDVVVIDYADILAPEDPRMEFRHQQNDTWMAMRALSQERSCHVLTATQADAASYGKRSIGASNFSEDKRKYSHVTMMITLNQLESEKRLGLMRIGKMFVRESDFDTKQHCTVLQCLKLARPYLGSYIKKWRAKNVLR